MYRLYFESLEVPPRFVLPPLCSVSRQLRLETTGLFFEHSTFTVWLNYVLIPRDQQLPVQLFAQPRQVSTHLHYHTEVARVNIPNQNFARIKHLSIELKKWTSIAPIATWTVDLSDGQCKIHCPTHQNVQGYHAQDVQTWVHSTMGREGMAKLEKSDLDELEVAITEAYYRVRP